MKNHFFKFLVLFLFTIVVTFTVADQTFGQIESKNIPEREGIEAGPIIVHGAVSTEIQFDSNVYLEKHNEESDLIFHLEPSVGAEVHLGDHVVSVEYDTDLYRFRRNNGQRYDDHYRQESDRDKFYGL